MITPTSTGKLPPSTDRTLLFRKLVICPYLFDICLYFLSLGVYCNKTISKAVFRGKNIQFNFLGISRTNIWNSTKGLAKAYFSQSFSTIYVFFFSKPQDSGNSWWRSTRVVSTRNAPNWEEVLRADRLRFLSLILNPLRPNRDRYEKYKSSHHLWTRNYLPMKFLKIVI